MAWLSDPKNWSEKMWEAHRKDMEELDRAIEKQKRR